MSRRPLTREEELNYQKLTSEDMEYMDIKLYPYQEKQREIGPSKIRHYQKIDMRDAYNNYQVIPDDQDRKNMNDWQLRVEANPFIEDRHIFNFSRFENIESDLFERHTLTDRWGIKSDEEYDEEIREDMLKATPDWTSQDLDQQTKIDARFDSQLDRIIFEDGHSAYGQIKIHQLISPGDCKIPNHLRPENIAKFAGVSNKRHEKRYGGLSEAEIISKMYRIIEVDFKTAIRINAAIRKRNRQTQLPWDIKINHQGTTLRQLAEAMKEEALGIEPAETIESKIPVLNSLKDLNRALLDIDQIDHNINEDIGRFIPADWEAPVQEFEQVNNIGEYSYHTINKIPQARYLSEDNARAFLKALSILESKTFQPKTLNKLNSWAEENLSWDQQAEYDSTLKRIMQEKALAAA